MIREGVLSRPVHPADRETYWERIALTRWGCYISNLERQAIVRSDAAAIERNEALEIGCEGGRWSKFLSDRGWHMTCTDVNPETLGACAQKVPSACCLLVRSDETILPCRSNSVDLILCIEVATVIKSDWFIPEADRVLKPGGQIVGVFHNLLSLRGIYGHTRSLIAGRPDAYYAVYPTWRKTVLRKGFAFRHEEGLCWFPFKRTSNSPLIPICTRLERAIGLRKMPLISPWVVFIAQKPTR